MSAYRERHESGMSKGRATYDQNRSNKGYLFRNSPALFQNTS